VCLTCVCERLIPCLNFFIYLSFLLTPLILSLNGCANAALAVTDPRKMSAVTSDQYLKHSLALKYSDKAFESDQVYVEVYNHEVLLTGNARNIFQKHKIIKVAAATPDVTKVFDYLSVSKNYVTSSAHDTWLTSKVKTSLVTSANVNSNDVKIVTTDGVVYILGIVYQSQLPRIIEVSRSIDGVKKVVPLVKYKSTDSKLNLPSSS